MNSEIFDPAPPPSHERRQLDIERKNPSKKEGDIQKQILRENKIDKYREKERKKEVEKTRQKTYNDERRETDRQTDKKAKVYG